MDFDKKKRKKHRNSFRIRDPLTNKIIKLSTKGHVFQKYIGPYIIGKHSVIDKFSYQDQKTFLKFLKYHHLLPSYSDDINNTIKYNNTINI